MTLRVLRAGDRVLVIVSWSPMAIGSTGHVSSIVGRTGRAAGCLYTYPRQLGYLVSFPPTHLMLPGELERIV